MSILMKSRRHCLLVVNKGIYPGRPQAGREWLWAGGEGNTGHSRGATIDQTTGICSDCGIHEPLVASFGNDTALMFSSKSLCQQICLSVPHI